MFFQARTTIYSAYTSKTALELQGINGVRKMAHAPMVANQSGSGPGRPAKGDDERRKPLPCRLSPHARQIFKEAAKKRSMRLGDYMDDLAEAIASIVGVEAGDGT